METRGSQRLKQRTDLPVKIVKKLPVFPGLSWPRRCQSQTVSICIAYLVEPFTTLRKPAAAFCSELILPDLLNIVMNIMLSCHLPPHTFSQQLERADAADKPAQAGGVECLGSVMGSRERSRIHAHSFLAPKSSLQICRNELQMQLQCSCIVADAVANAWTTRCDHK